MIKCKLFDHIIHIDDLGDRRCARCGSSFTKSALKKSLQFRFGDRWKIEYKNLREWKKRMKKKIEDGEKPEFFIIIRYKNLPY